MTQVLKKNDLAGKPSLAFIDLKAQQDRIKPQINQAIQKVLAHGLYIMGPEIQELEEKLAAFCGVRHALSCASGTDALLLILLAKGIGQGDAIFVPSFTFAATAEVVALLGATAVFVDSDEKTFNICPADLERAIKWAADSGLKGKAVITVDLFGLPADYENIEIIAKENGLWLLDDAAQSFGAKYKGRSIGSIGTATATSFFPAKPLGCYGDGGAIFTDDDELAALIKSLRVHGQGSNKYDNTRIGINGRLDTLQAAILMPKLEIFPDEIARRNKIARRYNETLAESVQLPLIPEGDSLATWAQYTIVLPDNVDRDRLAGALKEDGVPTAIYYPKPLHRQTAYQSHGRTKSLPVCEKLAQRVISLPMHPYLEEEAQTYIIDRLKAALHP